MTLVSPHAATPEERARDYQTFAADAFHRGDVAKHEAYLELARRELLDTLLETRKP